MPIDMKEVIGDAVERLLMEKKVKRLTVKEIVEECGITRQAFYYHFADIPELLQWIVHRKLEQALQEEGQFESPEECIKYWLLIGVNGRKEASRGAATNYARELEQIVFDEMVSLFSTLVEGRDTELDDEAKDFAIRYHCHAFMGILRDWKEEDTKNLDRIVHNISRAGRGQMSNWGTECI